MDSYSELTDDAGRRQTVPERVTAYFSQLDAEDQAEIRELRHELMESIGGVDESSSELHVDSTTIVRAKSLMQVENEKVFEVRHTVAYWISISFLFGAILFLSGSIFWLYEDHIETDDVYILVTVGFFVGTIAFLVGSYLGLYEVINTEDDEDSNPHRNRYCCPSKGTGCTKYIHSLSTYVFHWTQGKRLYRIGQPYRTLLVVCSIKSLSPMMLCKSCILLARQENG